MLTDMYCQRNNNNNNNKHTGRPDRAVNNRKWGLVPRSGRLPRPP
jgi:hypothetical protein